MKRLITARTVFIVVMAIFSVVLASQIYIHRRNLAGLTSTIIEYRRASLVPVVYPTNTPAPSKQPQLTYTPAPSPAQKPQNNNEAEPQIIYTDEDAALPWGVAQKVDDVTYTIKVGYDDEMASPQEILTALNQYRAVHEISNLVLDDKLVAYAQSRADYFISIGSTDKHQGFDEFLNNDDGFSQLGYRRLGENSFFGGPLTGTHLIEWVFAQSPGHDANQLDPVWTHVGIGTTSSSVNLVFGSGQI